MLMYEKYRIIVEDLHMFLKQVEIENFKGHVNCKLKLTSGFNLLIGDNGMGKTSILEAISVALGAFIAGIEDV